MGGGETATLPGATLWDSPRAGKEISGWQPGYGIAADALVAVWMAGSAAVLASADAAELAGGAAGLTKLSNCIAKRTSSVESVAAAPGVAGNAAAWPEALGAVGNNQMAPETRKTTPTKMMEKVRLVRWRWASSACWRASSMTRSWVSVGSHW
jgi:hypothetical protein